MPRKITTGTQTADSLENMAALFEHHATSLRAACALLRAEPAIPEIIVKQESSRVSGIEAMATWVGAATREAFEARIQQSQKNGVRKQNHPDTRGPKK
jgi:hypothetical protein